MSLPLLMPEAFILFPKESVFGVTVLGLIGLLAISYQEIRQGYVGRITIFYNAIYLWEIFYHFWDSLNVLIQYWIYFSSILGIIAIISYLLNESLRTAFYQVAFLTNGTTTIIVVLFLFQLSTGSF